MPAENADALQEEINALKKENRALNRKLKETDYLVSSYEQYAVFQKSIYESIKKQKNEQDIYLRLIFTNTPDIILVLDVQKMFVLGTKRNMREIGIDTDALTGKDFSAIFSPIMPEAWVQTLVDDLQEVVDTGEPKRYGGKQTTTILGRQYCYRINIIPFRDAAEQVTGTMIIMQDETDLHEMVLAAESSNRAKTNFLAKISHEIRTPMNAIAGMAELILREHITGLVREHAMSIKQASGGLMSIINDILDFSKIESDKLEITETEYLLSSLINNVVSTIRMRVLDKQISFTTNVGCDIPNRLIGDELRIRQILLNLLSNAFKYCEQGAISLQVSGENLSDGSVTLIFDISDTGLGIKPEDYDKLFENFVQLDRVANKGVEGTGLGLVITKNLCEAMGGGISVQSTYGEGSTFTVKIPQKFKTYEKFALVDDAENKLVLVYETRDAYASSVICSANSLGVNCTLVSNQSKFHEELCKNTYTHVFVSSFLFESTEKIIKNRGVSATIVLLAEYGESVINTKNVKTLEMPAHAAVIANILNGTAEEEDSENPLGSVYFIAPAAQILIVDDLITNLRVAEGLMLPYRMQIEVCRSGKEAIELVRHNIYDIVFMDHMMPEMDGVEATLKIRELVSVEGEDNNGYYQKVPIVALTANAVSGVREMFLQNGFNDFLAKPIEVAQLNAILETWLPPNKQKPCVPADRETAAPGFEIYGIDVRAGLYMTGGNEANYLRVLSAYYRDGAEKIELLAESCGQGSMKRYAAAAHAVKGASASVGAAKLSSLAKALELAAQNEDLEYVRANNDVFLDEFKTLLTNIGYVVSANNKSKMKINSDLLIKERVTKLKDALVNLDVELADNILSDLQGESWGDKTDAALEEIANKILICEYEQALEIVEKMME
ncbi:MAG: response regulator [Chitinispirillales bacterium]|jgi:signal transduction histidine kinase/CheY-like chemotaxis protein|nr:response regulator [Chitinispirillales bacterium]